jgi:hypothetical protein
LVLFCWFLINLPYFCPQNYMEEKLETNFILCFFFLDTFPYVHILSVLEWRLTSKMGCKNGIKGQLAALHLPRR